MDKIIHYAIPFFIVTVAMEAWASARWKPGNYEVKDTFASLTMGIGNVVMGLVGGGYIFACYSICYEYRVFSMPETLTWWSYLVLLFAEDFAYYWFHRISHESRLWWAAHETHHSSEHYNLSSALRQTWTSLPHGWIFWGPLGLLGFRPEQVLFAQSISLLYQYWIHTRLINRMGILEWVMNTPSHHRVHHGIDVPYLDKNYAGIFIIWDRLFGTFQSEEHEPTYGVTKQLGTFNVAYIGFHTWKEMWDDIRMAPDLRSVFLYVFGRPGWRHDGTGKTVPQLQAEWLTSRTATGDWGSGSPAEVLERG